MEKGKLLGIRIFVPDVQLKKPHSCYKKVKKSDFDKFLKENKCLNHDYYMEAHVYYRDSIPVARHFEYEDSIYEIRTCFVKHRTRNKKSDKGVYQKIICQTDSTFTIEENN